VQKAAGCKKDTQMISRFPCCTRKTALFMT